MPIVNGVYVSDSLPDAKQAQMDVFGSYSKKDMTDYSAAALNYLMKQQEQAYNLQLWNLTNEYNSPAAQMHRYQDAGLNPNLIYGQQNTASVPQAASASSFRSGNVAARKQQNAINALGQLQSIVHQAKDIYDYAKYGTTLRSGEILQQGAQTRLLGAQYDARYLENLWQNFLIGNQDSEDYSQSLRGKAFTLEQESKQQAMARVKALAAMIPDQQARTQALKALDDERLKIMGGQNDAILNIHTGNETVDSWLRALMYFAMSKL